MIIEILVALLAGLMGGFFSRYIPALPWRKQALTVEISEPGEHDYNVKFGEAVIYVGGDLRMAKIHRRENPGSVLIADGVNRG